MRIEGAETSALDDPQLERMLAARQLSREDARLFVAQRGSREPVREDEVLEWLAGEYGCAFSRLDEITPDKETLALFPPRLLLKEEMLPLRREGGVVLVATSHLFAPEAFDGIKLVSGLRPRPVLAPSAAIQREMKRWLGVGADTIGSIEEEAGLEVVADGDEEDGNLDGAEEDASIIRFVNQVLTDAINLRSSDIHLEPFEDELRLRYRVDGILQEIPVPASLKRFQPAIVSRIKILSHLDIAEKRLPQDGRIKVRLEGQEVDVRVSLIPMLHGEGVVMRLLKKDRALDGIGDLGMASRDESILRELIGMPHGIVLVTGPTGSGKSTTLYASLGEINDAVRKIITIEDPVEYHIKGISQIQVNDKTGLTFARGLRSILRHDPDVVLLGEIRDAETARIAVQASLTGHLVFSTLHTNDAPSAPTRLIDMGVEPYLVASSLEGIMAQRLVRVLCESCKTEDRSLPTLRFRRQMGIEESARVFAAAGCEECRKTGYRGRRGIFEMMRVDEQLRELILTSRSVVGLRDAARRDGMRTLVEDGWRLVSLGVTAIDEVLRVSRASERMGATEALAEEVS
ncbi:MAG: type II/IV secretion system protein [Candidatus Sumerlaeia bacterium]|nr:type II/IV secretion system protein [Candidatus Sumerlaeia bacterium]